MKTFVIRVTVSTVHYFGSNWDKIGDNGKGYYLQEGTMAHPDRKEAKVFTDWDEVNQRADELKETFKDDIERDLRTFRLSA